MQTHVVSVRDYMRMIFRRKWARVLPVLGGIFLFFPLWATMPEKYRAVATVRRQDYSATKTGPAALISSESPRIDVRAIEAEVFAWNNLHEVLVETKQDVDLHSPAEWQAKYDELRKAISVKPAAQSRGIDLIDFEVILPDPALAQQIANTVANNFVERSKSAQRSGGLTAIDFLQREMDKFRELLRKTEMELDRYRDEHFADLPDVKNGIRNRLLSLRIQEDARRLQLQEAQSRLEETEKQLAQIEPTVRSEVTKQQNPAVVDLRNSLSEKERALQMLLISYTDDHPEVVRLRAEIAAIKDQLEGLPERIDVSERQTINPQYQELLSERLRLKQEIRGHEAALRTLGAELAAHDLELADVVKQEKHYNDLLRNQREYSELYDQYRRQLAEAQRRVTVQEEEYVTRVELYAPALKPAIPYRRPVAKLAMACLFGGVAAGVALMFGLEFSDRSFRNVEDAAGFLKVPILGSLTTIVPPEVQQARRRRKWAIAGIVLVVLLVLLAAGTFWYIEGAHTPGDVVDGMRNILMWIKARMAG